MGIPCVNIENFKCPKFKDLVNRIRSCDSCGFHNIKSKDLHCPLTETFMYVTFLNSKMRLLERQARLNAILCNQTMTHILLNEIIERECPISPPMMFVLKVRDLNMCLTNLLLFIFYIYCIFCDCVVYFMFVIVFLSHILCICDCIFYVFVIVFLLYILSINYIIF